jgi:hypothetical protein
MMIHKAVIDLNPGSMSKNDRRKSAPAAAKPGVRRPAEGGAGIAKNAVATQWCGVLPTPLTLTPCARLAAASRVVETRATVLV